MNALIVVDMQKDFMPGGPLPTKGADELVPYINALMESYSLVVATKDWHSSDHISFAVNHPGKQVGDRVEVDGLEQILWPVHCVQESEGAEFVSGLNIEPIEQVFFKGVDKRIDSYSTFFDNAHGRSTGLADFLKKKGVKEITIVGVATEYCVLYSALDGLELGFEVTVMEEGCRAINLSPDDGESAIALMRQKGVKIG